jgi:hypothetical protein
LAACSSYFIRSEDSVTPGNSGEYPVVPSEAICYQGGPKNENSTDVGDGYSDEVLEFYAKVFRDEKEPTTVRMEAGERLLNRAFGRIVTPVETTGETAQTVRHVYNIRWLPPDPNDHSRVIEPEPDC